MWGNADDAYSNYSNSEFPKQLSRVSQIRHLKLEVGGLEVSDLEGKLLIDPGFRITMLMGILLDFSSTTDDGLLLRR